MKNAPGTPINRSNQTKNQNSNPHRHQQNTKTAPSFFKSFADKLSSICSCTGSKPASFKQIQVENSSGSNGKFKHYSSAESDTASARQVGAIRFSLEDIYRATGNFSLENKIGEGGFGNVYKARLKDGTLIAVKRAKKEKYDERMSEEFKNEVLTLSQIEHMNLVRFFGYLEHKDEQIILVEYVGNGTLREHLDGIRGDALEIAERLDIAIDVAHAVTYLHMYTDPPIIHRDIKSSNILITDKLRAKVADFGLARLGADDPGATHISTQVKGTTGYLDPEYLKTYQLTEKSDVYSFGVLLVELMTGRQPIEPDKPLKERVTIKWKIFDNGGVPFGRNPEPVDERHRFILDVITWPIHVRAMQRLKEGESVTAMDPRLRRSPASIPVVDKVLKLARQCLLTSRPARPPMKKCAEILWRIRKDFSENSVATNASTSTLSANVFVGDVRKNRHDFFGIEDSENYRFRSA